MPDRSFRIALLIHGLSGGGAERQICSLANHLVSMGLHCTLITLDNPSHDRYLVDPRVTRIGLDAMHSSRSLLAALNSNRKRILAVREAVRQSRVHCVISFCDKMNIVALAACRPLSLPIVISERSDPRRQKLGWLWETARRWQYPKCSACVAQTKGVAAYLGRIIGDSSRIEVIPSAIEPPTTTNTPMMRPNASVTQTMKLLYVGRLSHEKGPDRLLRAWSQIADKYSAWKLTLVGDGPLESSLQELCHNLAMERHVEFLGWQEDVWKQLAQAQAFVLPSRYEGFPGALIEAMYAKLPAVATDCSDSVCELIEHNRNGLIAKNNTDALRVELERLLADASLRGRLGIAAHESSKAYLWSTVGARWIDLIRTVTKSTSL